MSASNPSQAFVARCSVKHEPPNPPEFVGQHIGFASVELDTSAVATGCYVLVTDPPIDLSKNKVDATYVPGDPDNVNIGFMGIGIFNPALPHHYIQLVRLQLVPSVPDPVNGPFQVSITNLE